MNYLVEYNHDLIKLVYINKVMIVGIKMVPHKKGNGLLDLLCFNDHKFDKGVTINVFLTKKVWKASLFGTMDKESAGITEL